MNIESFSLLLPFLIIHSLQFVGSKSKAAIQKSDDEDIEYDEVEVFHGRPTAGVEEYEQDEQDEEDPAHKKIRYQKVTCGDTYYIQDNGYMRFRLNKKGLCTFDFLGSRASGCSVEIMCSGIETIDNEAKAPCKKEFIQISDGLGGRLRVCGKYSTPQPFKALYYGKDVYLKFNGTTKQGYCEIFCGEDKTSGHRYFETLKDLKSEHLPKAKKDSKYIEESCVCGMKREMKGRIVGGDTAHPFEYPWLAPIVFKNEKFFEGEANNFSSRSSFCGAALITDRHMITAAHCFFNTEILPDEVHVLLHAHVVDLFFNRDPRNSKERAKAIKDLPGINLPETKDEDEKTIRLELKDVLVHPLFNPRSYDFDIAIIYLKRRLNIKNDPANLVTPICLPPEDKHRNFSKKIIEVAGWGTIKEGGLAGSRVLQKVHLPILPWLNCSELVEDLQPRHICGYVKEGGKDSCQGDSGGPVMYKFNDKQYVQAGIVSSGVGCARKGVPGLYTDIPEVIQWVYFNTRRARWCKHSMDE